MNITRSFTNETDFSTQILVTNTLLELIDHLAKEYYASNTIDSTTPSQQEDVQQ